MAEANEICRMDTVTLAGRMKARELSPVEVVEAVLGRLERACKPRNCRGLT
jgi:Asp-tRNA(Asn)/Glu-tRNA(Gln) amidotransferase A subunit family amidase